VIDDHVRQNMKQVLQNIRSGAFAREWILENQAGRPSFLALRRQNADHMIEKVGSDLRGMMPWLKAGKPAAAGGPAAATQPVAPVASPAPQPAYSTQPPPEASAPLRERLYSSQETPPPATQPPLRPSIPVTGFGTSLDDDSQSTSQQQLPPSGNDSAQRPSF